jgi:hypothetical protein
MTPNVDFYNKKNTDLYIKNRKKMHFFGPHTVQGTGVPQQLSARVEVLGLVRNSRGELGKLFFTCKMGFLI